MENPDKQLYEAIRSGNVQTVANSLERGAKIEGSGEHPFSPLYNTVISPCDEESQLSIANLLLERGADPNRQVATHTNLVMALRRNRAELVKLLLDYNASTLSEDNDSIELSLVELALHLGHSEMVPVLESAQR